MPSCPISASRIDSDNDGYGSPRSAACTKGAALACNDNNPDVHPGAFEICGNGLDDNCNGQLDEKCITC